MTLTKERKILAGVLLLGLGVLVTDLVTREATPSSGDAATAVAPVNHQPIEPLGQPSMAAKPGVAGGLGGPGSLATRLRELGARTGVDTRPPRDAFRWPNEATSSAEANTPDAAAPTATEVAADVRVTGLLHDASKRSGQALINGKLVRVGQTFDGYVLRAVEEASVVVARQGRAYRVRMIAE